MYPSTLWGDVICGCPPWGKFASLKIQSAGSDFLPSILVLDFKTTSAFEILSLYKSVSNLGNSQNHLSVKLINLSVSL